MRDLQLAAVPEVKVLMHAEPQVTISEAANEVVILFGSAYAILTEELQMRQFCSAITDTVKGTAERQLQVVCLRSQLRKLAS